MHHALTPSAEDIDDDGISVRVGDGDVGAGNGAEARSYGGAVLLFNLALVEREALIEPIWLAVPACSVWPASGPVVGRYPWPNVCMASRSTERAFATYASASGISSRT